MLRLLKGVEVLREACEACAHRVDVDVGSADFAPGLRVGGELVSVKTGKDEKHGLSTTWFASGQMQLDIYGELADAIAQAMRGGLPRPPRQRALREAMLQHLEKTWRQPEASVPSPTACEPVTTITSGFASPECASWYCS